MKTPLQTLPVLLLLCLSACSLTQDLAPSRMDPPPQIESVRPGILQEYKAFYVAPVDIYTVEGDVLNRVDNRETIKLAEDFRSKIIRQLGDNYTIMSQPAKNVAFLKVAITDVSSNYALLQLRPGLVVPNNARGGASIDAKFIDSISKKQLVSYRGTKQGERTGYLTGLGKWDGVQRAFDEWAGDLAAALRK